METPATVGQAVYRILDANCNRASEGLRTLEEYFRFVVEEVELATALKQLRHELATLTASFDRTELLKSRDATGDIGQSIKMDTEITRVDLASIVSAAAHRVQQSLRCLEEFSKIIQPTTARSIELLRYRAYDVLAKAELHSQQHRSWLFQARLYVLIDCQLPLKVFLDRALALSMAGVEILQIREKNRPARTISAYAKSLSDCLDTNRTRLIINDRVDMATPAMSGVHLGQEDLAITEARPLLRTYQCIGISTHSIEQAHDAENFGADYIGCGPTFPSQTKGFEDFPGLDFLRQVADQIAIPAFAIGGITLDRLDEVLATGASRVAVSRAIWHADNPGQMASLFASRLASHVSGNKTDRTENANDSVSVEQTTESE
ncbi:MAG: thiamine phosphate synthase [Pirellulaceae bacterium]|nr:thiamine phosphate synthase [Pirellulaceae bacterium]